jgi:long-chain acyl-CoA synthetase
MEKIQTVQALTRALGSAGDTPCLIALQRDGTTHWSYAEVADYVNRLAHGLAAAGLERGTRAVVLDKNRPEWVLACLAVLHAGGVVVPLDTQIGHDALHRAVSDSGSEFVFTTTDYQNRLAQLELDHKPRLILFDVPDDDERGWRVLLHDGGGDLPEVGPDDPAALFYTSGTTGVPKGVPLMHRNLTYQINAILETGLVQPHDRVLQPLPMYHVYPFTVGLLIPMGSRVPLILPQSIGGAHIVKAAQEGEATFFIGVPRLYRAIFTNVENQFRSRGKLASTFFDAALALSMQARQRTGMLLGRRLFGALHKRFGGKLRVLASGGSALDPDLAAKLEGLGWEVAIGYGLTETSPILTAHLPGAGKLASVGAPLPGVEIRIDTAIDEEEVQHTTTAKANGGSGEGELLARGVTVFAGYRNLPDQTAEVLTEDGWFRTGDLGYTDADNFVYISGRASTLIVTEGGKNIQPEPLEEQYQQHAYIQEIGILQHENRLVALVVPEIDEVNRRANGDTERAIREAMGEQAQQVATYQRIGDYAITPEPLPKTNLGKIRRHTLKELYVKAKQGIIEATDAPSGPIAPEDMSENDRALLEHPVSRQVWEWLANRYADRRLTPDTSPQLDLGIDSLAWLNLTNEVSEQTGVELNDQVIRRVNTVRDLLQEVQNVSKEDHKAPQASPLTEPEAVLTEEQKQWLTAPGPLVIAAQVLLFGLVRAVLRTVFRMEIRGAENLPEDTPFVLAPNHTSYLDAPSIASALSFRQVRRIYWAGSVDVMFSHPVMRLISRLSQTVPVAGEAAGSGRSSLAFAAITLKHGRCLVWFPEGRMSTTGELLPFRQGLGLVLNHFDVPVVPVHIEGTYDALPPGRNLPRFKPIRVTFGEPYAPEELAAQGAGDSPAARTMQALQERVEQLIAEREHSTP